MKGWGVGTFGGAARYIPVKHRGGTRNHLLSVLSAAILQESLDAFLIPPVTMEIPPQKNVSLILLRERQVPCRHPGRHH